MIRNTTLAAMTSLAFLLSPSMSTAQSAEGKTRASVKMERDEFKKTHVWHEPTATWQLREGVEPPPGAKTRAEVKAERDRFLSTHRWDRQAGGWVPLSRQPRELSKLTREEMKAEVRRFTRTHRWDEETETYVARNARERSGSTSAMK